MDNICKTVANSTPHGMGIEDKQILVNMSWKDAYATVLATWLFPILLCSSDPKRENSALNTTFGSVFFLTWIFISN